MVESMVPFFFAVLECQQGQARSAGHSLEHIADADRATIAERLCWRCASPTCVPLAVLTSSNSHLSANMSPESSGLLLLCHLLLCNQFQLVLQSEQLLKYTMWVWFTFLATLEEGQGAFLPFAVKTK